MEIVCQRVCAHACWVLLVNDVSVLLSLITILLNFIFKLKISNFSLILSLLFLSKREYPVIGLKNFLLLKLHLKIKRVEGTALPMTLFYQQATAVLDAVSLYPHTEL